MHGSYVRSSCKGVGTLSMMFTMLPMETREYSDILAVCGFGILVSDYLAFSCGIHHGLECLDSVWFTPVVFIRLVPAGDTEFAKDAVFGYKASNLREVIGFNDPRIDFFSGKFYSAEIFTFSRLVRGPAF